MHLRCLSWTGLNRDNLHDCLQLRAEVFVVEQDCVYQDIDGKDPLSHHVLGYSGGHLVACARLLPRGVSFEDACAIGRVVTAVDRRGDGTGNALMTYCVSCCAMLWPETPIRLSAQAHLERFYNRFGFTVCGPGYLEDGIPHVPMLKPPD